MLKIPVISDVTSDGIAIILKQASICCLTKGLVGAINIIFPDGYHR